MYSDKSVFPIDSKISSFIIFCGENATVNLFESGDPAVNIDFSYEVCMFNALFNEDESIRILST